MRARVIENTWGFNGLNIVERPVPQPGRDEVVLRMLAAILNYWDQPGCPPRIRTYHW